MSLVSPTGPGDLSTRPKHKGDASQQIVEGTTHRTVAHSVIDGIANERTGRQWIPLCPIFSMNLVIFWTSIPSPETFSHDNLALKISLQTTLKPNHPPWHRDWERMRCSFGGQDKFWLRGDGIPAVICSGRGTIGDANDHGTVWANRRRSVENVAKNTENDGGAASTPKSTDNQKIGDSIKIMKKWSFWKKNPTYRCAKIR